MLHGCIATEPPAKRDCQVGHCGLCQKEPKVPGLCKKHTATQPVMPKMSVSHMCELSFIKRLRYRGAQVPQSTRFKQKNVRYPQ